MSAVSRFSDALSAVVDLLGTPEDFLVVEATSGIDTTEDCVFIGHDGNPLGNMMTGEINQDWASVVGTNRRDEVFDIIGAVSVVRGTDDVREIREIAFGILGVVESALRANPGLGFSPPFVAGIRPREVYTRPVTDGMQVHILFVITVKTRV